MSRTPCQRPIIVIFDLKFVGSEGSSTFGEPVMAMDDEGIRAHNRRQQEKERRQQPGNEQRQTRARAAAGLVPTHFAANELSQV